MNKNVISSDCSQKKYKFERHILTLNSCSRKSIDPFAFKVELGDVESETKTSPSPLPSSPLTTITLPSQLVLHTTLALHSSLQGKGSVHLYTMVLRLRSNFGCLSLFCLRFQSLWHVIQLPSLYLALHFHAGSVWHVFISGLINVR